MNAILPVGTGNSGPGHGPLPPGPPADAHDEAAARLDAADDAVIETRAAYHAALDELKAADRVLAALERKPGVPQ